MIVTTNTEFSNDLAEEVRLFAHEVVQIEHVQERQNGEIINAVTIDGREFFFRDTCAPSSDALVEKRHLKRYAKLAVFRAMTEITGVIQPWGALSGIRPTALLRQLERENGRERAIEILKNTLLVGDEKLGLLTEINAVQQQLLNDDPHRVDVYVGVPFCTTRCAYCSFLSAEISRCGKMVDEYVEALKTEIVAAKRMIKENAFTVGCVYVGGGTPTALPEAHLKEILSKLDFPAEEFTVEAGRPDTITDGKLRIIADAGANRISVNPQSLKEETLALIGRNHSPQQFYDAYQLAKKYPMKINVDLIAALPEESESDFMSSLAGVAELLPDNVTVHTLALKRGSILKEKNYSYGDVDAVMNMVSRSRSYLTARGYMPYYMYRQKYMSGNLENVGYFRGDSICRYNIDIMEETTSILACGANAITKAVYPDESRIERQANPKDIRTYIDKLSATIEKKEILLKSL